MEVYSRNGSGLEAHCHREKWLVEKHGVGFVVSGWHD